MKGEQALYSRKSDEWETPIDLFKSLDEEFHFNLDPCSSEDNFKCQDHITKQEDGLQKSWGGAKHLLIPHIPRLQNG